jgi:hypothetical protein
MIKKSVLKWTTNGSGAATVVGTESVVGVLRAIVYLPATTATGATVTVTSEGPISKPLLTKANAGVANTVFYPRDIQHAVADGAALTATAGGDRTMPLVDGHFKVVIASGGNATSGSLLAYYEV